MHPINLIILLEILDLDDPLVRGINVKLGIEFPQAANSSENFFIDSLTVIQYFDEWI